MQCALLTYHVGLIFFVLMQNLQTDYIDLLYLHVDDFSVPQKAVMQTLNDLVAGGMG